MAVKIRLQRMGSKRNPFYRIVVADSRSPRDGRQIEQIGTYNPVVNPVEVKIDEAKALDWMTKGAKPSDTVRNLFSKEGIMKKFHDQKNQVEKQCDIMKALIESIVTPLVDHPEDIVVKETEEDTKIVYHLTVHQEDVGKVIGKNGRIAKAIRTVVYAAKTDGNKRIYLDIM